MLVFCYPVLFRGRATDPRERSPAVQVKHLSLSPSQVGDICGGIQADKIIIVCRSIEAASLKAVLEQVGLGNRIRGIITEKELTKWYQLGCGEKYHKTLGADLVQAIFDEVAVEFPITQAQRVKAFFEERGYDASRLTGLWAMEEAIVHRSGCQRRVECRSRTFMVDTFTVIRAVPHHGGGQVEGHGAVNCWSAVSCIPWATVIACMSARSLEPPTSYSPASAGSSMSTAASGTCTVAVDAAFRRRGPSTGPPSCDATRNGTSELVQSSRQGGWRVMVIWECQINLSRLDRLRAKIVAFLDRDVKRPSRKKA